MREIGYKICFKEKESVEDFVLKQGLKDFNRTVLGESGSHFRIIAIDNREVVGGLIIEKCRDALYILKRSCNERAQKKYYLNVQ